MRFIVETKTKKKLIISDKLSRRGEKFLGGRKIVVQSQKLHREKKKGATN